jgi:hypothetical protein
MAEDWVLRLPANSIPSQDERILNESDRDEADAYWVRRQTGP